MGLITAVYLKDPADPQWKNDPAFKAYKAWFDKYYPEGDIKDGFNVAGYVIAEGVVQVLKMCGDDLYARERDEADGIASRTSQCP